MKRTGFSRPSGEQMRAALARQRERQQESARRYAESRKAKAEPGAGRLERGRWSTKAGTARRKERAHKRFKRAFLSVEFVLWIKAQPCAAPGCWRTDIQCAHVGKPRSRGGRWYEVAPLCGEDGPGHHQEQEGRTKEFEAKYRINLESIAHATAQRGMAKIGTRTAE